MLLPEDDYPLHQSALPLAHVMNGHPNAYDRFFFNGYNADYYFGFALGLYPNRGVIDAAFSVSVGDTQRSVFAGDALRGRPTAVGPLRIEIEEPMRVNCLSVDAPEQGLRAELRYTARTDALQESRQTMHDGPRIFLDVSRATQLGTWSGWIETPDGRFSVDAGTYGTKDRSWGVRPVGEALPGPPSERAPQICFQWTPLNFPDGALHFTTFDDHSGRPISRTIASLPLLGEGQPVMQNGHLQIEPERGTRRAARAVLVVDDTDVRLTPIRTFYMRGLGYGHPQFAHGRWQGGAFCEKEELDLQTIAPLDFPNIHVQQVCTAIKGEENGLGVLESLIIGPYAPMGLSGLLDGA